MSDPTHTFQSDAGGWPELAECGLAAFGVRKRERTFSLAITPDMVPGAFIHVFAQLDAIGAGDDEPFFNAHFRVAADLEVKPFLDRGQSEFEHVHDPKAHIVFVDEDRADPLREIPQRPD
jgi:hypothetical protein